MGTATGARLRATSRAVQVHRSFTCGHWALQLVPRLLNILKAARTTVLVRRDRATGFSVMGRIGSGHDNASTRLLLVFYFFKGYYSYKLVRQLMLIVRTWLHSQQTARRGNPNHAAVLRPGGDIRSACLDRCGPRTRGVQQDSAGGEIPWKRRTKMLMD